MARVDELRRHSVPAVTQPCRLGRRHQIPPSTMQLPGRSQPRLPTMPARFAVRRHVGADTSHGCGVGPSFGVGSGSVMGGSPGPSDLETMYRHFITACSVGKWPRTVTARRSGAKRFDRIGRAEALVGLGAVVEERRGVVDIPYRHAAAHGGHGGSSLGITHAKTMTLQQELDEHRLASLVTQSQRAKGAQDRRRTVFGQCFSRRWDCQPLLGGVHTLAHHPAC